MNTSAAEAIDGWMSGPELRWLAEQASKHKLIVEIGCYKGRSTRALADNTKGVVLAYDNFHGPSEVELSDADRKRIFSEYLANTAECTNIITFSEDHGGIVYTGLPVDMVFIDGSHNYHAVKSDIAYWWDHLKRGGLMCGHDYGTNWPGVDKAVQEMLGEPERGPDSIWYRQCV